MTGHTLFDLGKIDTAHFRIIIDTSSWMTARIRTVLNESILPFVRAVGHKIVVPKGILDELNKNAASAEAGNAARAGGALIQELRQAGTADVFDGSEDTFVDNVIQMVLTRFAEKLDFLLLTQDRQLAADALRIGFRRSVKRQRQIQVYRVNPRTGGVERWDLDPADPMGPARSTPVRARLPEETPATEGHRAAVGAQGPVRVFPLFSGKAVVDNTPLPRIEPPGQGDRIVDDSGQVITLTETLGAGGEGIVFLTDRGLACKVYAGDRRTVGIEAKLRRMITVSPDLETVCWPRSIARNERGEFVGYLMPRAEGHMLQVSVFIPPLLKTLFPSWTRHELVQLAISILESIAYLNARSVLLGDINPRNILVKSPREAFLVDTDSFQIEQFPCPVGTAAFLHPDLVGKDLKAELRTILHENYAVATLVFMLLMAGKPPYSYAGGQTVMDNQRTRHFPYAFSKQRATGVPPGPWRLMWSHLPFKLKEALHSAFTDNSLPDAQAWLSLLRAYASDLKAGYHRTEIFPSASKRLSKVATAQMGGHWLRCIRCHTEFGSMEPAAQYCPDCATLRKKVKCDACKALFESRVVGARRSGATLCKECREKSYTLTCRECRQQFEITALEAFWFHQQKLVLPKRCKECRLERQQY